MVAKVLNLTELVAQTELNQLLLALPSSHPYRALFRSSQPRRQLIAFVLERMPNRYTCLWESEPSRADLKALVPPERRSRIVSLLKTGMSHVYHCRDRRTIARGANARRWLQEPSHWFG
ncbi:MAG: hypothetical protein BRC58_02975 [Cyanobacteria bacterium QS_8_64_29]|nr:MAG: hypothetical protein BRC58_02975 [Cyanobacteria bacterium QS_8_64_29]